MQKQQAATVVHLQIRIDQDTQRQLCHDSICQVYTIIVDIYFSGGLDDPHQLVMITSSEPGSSLFFVFFSGDLL